MSHAKEVCVFCRAKLDPALENRNVAGGWVKIAHSYHPGCAIMEPTHLRHTGVAKNLCQQVIPSMLSGTESEIPTEKLEAALVVLRSRKERNEALEGNTDLEEASHASFEA